MGVGRGEDPGKPDDPGSEQREARHAVAGLPEILDQSERCVGVRRQHALIQDEVARGCVEIALRERGIIVRYFDKPRINEFLRISIGTDSECDALVKALSEIL